MAKGEIHLELLLGKRVLDPAGKPVGRIEEMHAERRDGEWVIREYLIGPAALFQRLAAWPVAHAIAGIFGAGKLEEGPRVPWDKLDLSYPEHPRLLCSVEELGTFSAESED